MISDCIPAVCVAALVVCVVVVTVEVPESAVVSVVLDHVAAMDTTDVNAVGTEIRLLAFIPTPVSDIPVVELHATKETPFSFMPTESTITEGDALGNVDPADTPWVDER